MAEDCAAVSATGWPVVRKGTSGRTDVLTGWWSLVQAEKQKLDLNRNFTWKRWTLVMSFPLGALRVCSWPTSLMHKANLDTEGTGWVLPVMGEARQWWQELFCNTGWSQSQLLPGACFRALLVNVENRLWTATALKNCCKAKGTLWCSKPPHFRSSLRLTEQHKRLMGISHPLKWLKFMA